MILVDAVYICQSGGKILLDLLFDKIEKGSSNDVFLFLIDSRIKEFYIEKQFQHNKVEFLNGNEYARYKFYSKNKNAFRKVFCFANIPPPIKLKCEVITYFQNVLLLDKSLQRHLTLKKQLIFALKTNIIKQRKNNTDFWLVQTHNVKDIILRTVKPHEESVSIIPFFNDDNLQSTREIKQKKNDFFYPAIGEIHKNHERLLLAWSNLYDAGECKYPLHLTIDERLSRKISLKIKKLQKRGIPIINHGYLRKTDIDELYSKCKFVIHPSLGESFGLVLIEALKSNCILLAPDLPYVNAIVKPNYFFNAYKVDSIEESIKQAVSGENYSNSEVFVKSDIEGLVNYFTK